MILVSLLNAAFKQLKRRSGASLAGMTDRLRAFRHEFLPSYEEIENRYLDDAVIDTISR